ncbi:MAG TPA: acyl carrier protein [Actinocrinis sp.]|nr:acyl carrier protein [Actinocrinis sp.]
MTDDDIMKVILDSLREMNYDTSGLGDDTLLGPAGADLESLALAELLVRVEERFDVRFEDDEAEELAVMTVGEFRAAVAERARTASGAVG